MKISKRIADKNEQDIVWWNNLDINWKKEFISNLLYSSDYKDKGLSNDDILETLKYSSKIITDIVNLKKLEIYDKVLTDLTPIFYLSDLEEFRIFEPNWDDPNANKIIERYPKELRSKVKRLTLDGIPLGELTKEADFSIFEDFINLEYLQIQCCHFESLKGIEKLKKLKSLTGGMNNNFNGLHLLRGLPIKYLDLEWQKLDISPLLDVPTLEYLILNCLTNNNDYSVLFHLPNLQTVIFDNWVQVDLKTTDLKNFLMKNYNTDENGFVKSAFGLETAKVAMKNLCTVTKGNINVQDGIDEQSVELPF
jgi:hypothetical protein